MWIYLTSYLNYNNVIEILLHSLFLGMQSMEFLSLLLVTHMPNHPRENWKPGNLLYWRPRINFLSFVFFQYNSFHLFTLLTLPTAEILSGKNVRAFLVCVFLMKWYKKNILKIWKKSWEPFGSYLLNSTANPAHFHPTSKRLPRFFSYFQDIFFQWFH